jgi:hypothetical protein
VLLHDGDQVEESAEVATGLAQVAGDDALRRHRDQRKPKPGGQVVGERGLPRARRAVEQREAPGLHLHGSQRRRVIQLDEPAVHRVRNGRREDRLVDVFRV